MAGRGIGRLQRSIGLKWLARLGVGCGLVLAGLALIAPPQARAFDPAKIRAALEPLPETLEQKYYLDDLYENGFLKIGLLGGVAWLLALWDKYVVDGLVNGVGRGTAWVSGQIKVAQAGQETERGGAASGSTRQSTRSDTAAFPAEGRRGQRTATRGLR